MRGGRPGLRGLERGRAPRGPGGRWAGAGRGLLGRWGELGHGRIPGCPIRLLGGVDPGRVGVHVFKPFLGFRGWSGSWEVLGVGLARRAAGLSGGRGGRGGEPPEEEERLFGGPRTPWAGVGERRVDERSEKRRNSSREPKGDVAWVVGSISSPVSGRRGETAGGVGTGVLSLVHFAACAVEFEERHGTGPSCASHG